MVSYHFTLVPIPVTSLYVNSKEKQKTTNTGAPIQIRKFVSDFSSNSGVFLISKIKKLWCVSYFQNQVWNNCLWITMQMMSFCCSKAQGCRARSSVAPPLDRGSQSKAPSLAGPQVPFPHSLLHLLGLSDSLFLTWAGSSSKQPYFFFSEHVPLSTAIQRFSPVWPHSSLCERSHKSAFLGLDYCSYFYVSEKVIPVYTTTDSV